MNFPGAPIQRLGAGGSGSSFAGWTLLRSVDQVDGLPVDPGGMGTTGTLFDTSTGRATIVGGAHTTLVVGYQNAQLRWTKLLSELYPDFDYKRDTLELGVDLVTFPHGSVEAGVWVGLLDHLTVDASLQGACAGMRQAGAAQDQLSLITATGSTPISNLGLLTDELHAAIVLGNDGTDYPSLITTRYNPEATSRLNVGVGGAAGTLRAAALANWRLAFGLFHGSVDSLSGTTIAFDVYHRRLRRTTGPFL
jgi:hypothetical protein